MRVVLQLQESLAIDADRSQELIEIHEALTELEQHDAQAAALVKLRFFAGRRHQEAAAMLGISRRAADRLWLLARLAVPGPEDRIPVNSRIRVHDQPIRRTEGIQGPRSRFEVYAMADRNVMAKQRKPVPQSVPSLAGGPATMRLHLRMPKPAWLFRFPSLLVDESFGRSGLFIGGFAFMRFKLGIPAVAWSAFSFAAVALAALIAGCDSGGGGPAPGSPEAKLAAQSRDENLKKLEDAGSAAGKKAGATVKFGGKPGAVGGN